MVKKIEVKKLGKLLPNGQYMLSIKDLEKIFKAEVGIGRYGIFITYKKKK